MTDRQPAVLYISYDGMLEPLGQSQVLAYAARLAANARITIMSFEKPEDWADRSRRDAMRSRMAAAGLRWVPLRYHRRPTAPATGYDVARGIAMGLYLVLRHRIGIVHARSYVAASMAVALKRLTGVRLLFDMRGFWADERVDAGLWSREGRLYRGAKAFERTALTSADHIVSLTDAAIREMATFPYLAGHTPPTTKIPTCVDIDRFVVPVAPRTAEPLVVGYVGAAGRWYLLDESIALFARIAALRPDARLLIVNRGEHATIREALANAGIADDRVELIAADHGAMPQVMARIDIGLCLVAPLYSGLAKAPTKLGELLACGVPCAVSEGAGDMAGIVRETGTGIVVQAFDTPDLDRAARALVALSVEPGVAQRCADAARHHFALEEGVRRYAAIYATLASAAPDAAN